MKFYLVVILGLLTVYGLDANNKCTEVYYNFDLRRAYGYGDDRFAFSKLEKIILNQTAFSGLNLTCLKKVWLQKSKIVSIDSTAFNGLTNLEELTLSFNKLTKIDSSTFKGLTNLEDLKLSFNQLTEIDSSIFNGLDKLKYLYLGSNSLTIITNPDILKKLKSLHHLDLSKNKLPSNIDKSQFPEFTKWN